MGIFTRARDIIAANINALLDEAEDPEKLATLMVREMEDTLIELKASCAGAMAAKQRIMREQADVHARADDWSRRAQRAVDKGRDALAREALHEKKRYVQRAEYLEQELTQCDAVIEQYQQDIAQLDEKLETARERRRMLVQRHVRALNKRRAQTDIRRMETSEVFARFDDVERHIERVEAEADLVNFGRRPGLVREIDALDDDGDIDAELNRMKAESKAPQARPQ